MLEIKSSYICDELNKPAEMSKKHIMRKSRIFSTRAFTRKSHIFAVPVILACMFLMTCDGSSSPVEPPMFDPTRPTVSSFAAYRGTAKITDNLVYGGEDIRLNVDALSHAFPVSCGLTEDDVVQDNLLYTFTAYPPEGIPAPGVFSQERPPSNEAIWRVPNLNNYDPGEGLLYNIQVVVYDECLRNQSTGTITLRAFANEGSPILNSQQVRSAINSGSPVTEILDQNGLYEIERADECRINVTASSRTSSTICSNRGIVDGEELEFTWTSTRDDINLSFDENPIAATSADFDIPLTISYGEKFQVQCRIRDRCTNVSTYATFFFTVVGAPVISSFGGTSNGLNLSFDPYFDTYEVLPADKIIMAAAGLVMDDPLCDSKGIHPDLQWNWAELTGTIPKLEPEYDPVPELNDTSSIEFVIPAVANGSKYRFRCTVTDRCNGLTDIENANFLVIVPPTASATSVKVGTTQITPSTSSGRYEVKPNDEITIRITGSGESSASFCAERGIGSVPALLYSWENPFDILILSYEAYPNVLYSDLVFVLPFYTPDMDRNLTCTVTDVCNGLSTQVVVPFRVLPPDEE